MKKASVTERAKAKRDMQKENSRNGMNHTNVSMKSPVTSKLTR